jgi:hypothetical protein
MTTIIINEKTKKGKIIIELIREMGMGKIIEDNVKKTPNKKTSNAIREAINGETTKCNSFDDYLEKVK